VLEILKFFINGYGENLEAHLIPLTQILLKCLDPNELALRKNSHKIISVILSIMVKMFPMVAFHHESQRLAVGTHDGPIAIYDVRTSAKWKILEGHSGNVTCLTFDSKGNLLASYSAVDLTVRLWKVGNTGFFSTIMGGTGKSANTLTLDPISGAQNPHSALMLKKHQSVQ
jgi:WD40 repeat protein